MMINSTCSMPAVIANAAKPFKACCGKTSYTIATLLEACKGNFIEDFYEMEIDGKRISMEGQQQERISSSLLMVCNGKYTGGGMIINPFACMNDGMVDATWIHDPRTQSLTGVAGMLDKASKKGGIQIYDQTSTYMRGKKITLRFVGKNIRNQREDYGEQLFGIDGEDLRFTRQISWECIANNIEVLFDTENYWRDQEFKIEQQQQARKQEEADPALLSKEAAPEDQV
jgi:diacylglycerol kinase family enzyme